MIESGYIDRKRFWILLGAVFLISFSLISLEITLTRLLSVLLSYHYVFVVLSLVLLGLGLGGIFIHFFRRWRPGGPRRISLLTYFACLFSLTISFSIILIIQMGYIDIIRDNILFYCLLLFIPFFSAGVILAEIYRMFPTLSAKIYGVDLVGAAAGSSGAIFVLDIFGGISTFFLFSVMTSCAALLFAIGDSKKNMREMVISTISFLTVSILLGINLFGIYQPSIPIGRNPSKEIHDSLYGSSFKGKIIDTNWNAFGRTDLVEYSNYPDQMDIYLDGTAGSPMYRFSGNINDPGTTVSNLKTTFPGYFPFHHLKEEERNNALVIGPGGGRDILLTLMGGVQKITAVEINKDVVDLVRKYSWFNGGIYTKLDNVNIVVDEGRNFLRRQREKYDIIMMSLPVTNTSRSLEGYALTENFLFTIESINDYLNHLTEEGQLVVVAHDDVEILRLISISLAALSRRGINHISAMKQIYIVGSDMYPVFVMKKVPFETTEVFLMYKAMHQFGYDPKTSYFPYILKVGALNPALMAFSSGKIQFNELEKMVKERGYDISPTTDDSPFFYKFEIGMPRPVSLVFGSSIITLLLMIIVPTLFRKIKATQPKVHSENKRYFNHNILKFVLIFSMLGIGFMLIEISFIQRFVFFLGQPMLSLAILLFSLLGGAGMGSFWSGRLTSNKINKGITIASLSIVLAVLSYTFLLPIALDQLLGLNLIIRILTSIFVLIPLGFLIGFPFPLSIRLLKEMRMETHIPWMWGINGVSSVLGSVMTILIAISLGFTEALLISAGCYFIIFLIFLKSYTDHNV